MHSETVEAPMMSYEGDDHTTLVEKGKQTLLKVGTVVKVKDETGYETYGLVTAVHGPACINVVYLGSDPTKRDPYGVQSEHLSSLQLKSEFTAHGRYYEHI